jgi:hypothetical protein
MDKKNFLLIIALLCVSLYFYGQYLQKDSKYLEYLPTIGGGAYALNFIVKLAT